MQPHHRRSASPRGPLLGSDGRWTARPGPLQYVYTLLAPAFLVFMGAATVVVGITDQAEDWGSRLGWAFGLAGAGVLFAAYVLGMRLEVDAAHVTKVYFFGWMRESIPRDQLAVYVDQTSNRRAVFINADGKGAFGLYPNWVWRRRDVNALIEMQARPWPGSGALRYVTPVKRQNLILAVGALVFGASPALLFVIAVLLLITHGLFHWPS